MDCKLCLKYDVDSFDLEDDEATQQNAQLILQKYFYFCFTDDRKGGRVCRKCWLCVETFNNFYLHVEYVHVHLSSIEHSKGPDAQRLEKASSVEESTPVIVKIETLNEEAIPPTDTPFYSDSESDWAPDNSEVFMKSENETTLNDENETNVAAKPKKAQKKKRAKRKRTEKFQCEQCGDSFLSQVKLHKHMKETHDIVPFRCTEKGCQGGFQSSKALRNHIEREHNKGTCSFCNKELKMGYLPTHIKNNHSAQSHIICDMCGKVSKNQRDHTIHMETIHTDNPGIQCDICGKWVKHMIAIRRHMNNFHINNKPVKCGICGWVSKNQTAYRSHRKKKHVEGFSTRFKCLVCGHGFGDRTKLKEHSYIHSGITDAYKCPVCHKAFRFGSSLSLHKKTCPAKNE